MTVDTDVAAPPAGGEATPRRVPSQQRSRERVERILAVATTLIAEGGSDSMRMSDLAERAGVSIGSLYQYFPDKAAIVRTLAERYDAIGRACVARELAQVQDAADLRVSLASILDQYYASFLAEPVMRDIWSGTQADKALVEMDVAEGRLLSNMLFEVKRRLQPDADPAELAATSLLTMHLIAATVRFAISVERTEGDALVAAFKRLLLGDAWSRSGSPVTTRR